MHSTFRAVASCSATALFLLVASSCSDRYWIRKAESAHQYREITFNARCVDIAAERGPADCPQIEAQLRADEVTLDAVESAAQRGSLPKTAREQLKSIARKP